jgi:hypothetical protein
VQSVSKALKRPSKGVSVAAARSPEKKKSPSSKHSQNSISEVTNSSKTSGSKDIETIRPRLLRSEPNLLTADVDLKPSRLLRVYDDYDDDDISAEGQSPSSILNAHRSSKSRVSRPNSANSTYSVNGTSSGNAMGARHLSKSLQVLELYSSLLSPLSRAEALAESQVVNITLRGLQIDGATIVELATKKIQLWWRMNYPRMRLRKRMACVQFIRGIIFSVVSDVEVVGMKRLRRKRLFEKLGAVIKIQKLFRHWRNTVLTRIQMIKRAWKRSRARLRVRKLVTQVRAGILIFRFVLRHFKRKYRKIPTRIKLKRVLQGVFSSIGVKSNRSYLSLKGDEEDLLESLVQERLLLEDERDPERVSLEYSLSPVDREHLERKRKTVARKELFALIVRLQAFIRMVMTKKRTLLLSRKNASRARLSLFRGALRMRSLLHKRSFRRRMAIKIQKAWRGYKVRINIEKKLRATYRILQAYRIYKSYRNVKQNLRRIEHTLKFTFKMLHLLFHPKVAQVVLVRVVRTLV